MSDTQPPADGDAAPGDTAPGDRALGEVDPGEPIAELRGLEEETSPQFLVGVHRRVDRRELSGQVLQIFGVDLGAIFLEFLKNIFQALGPSERQKPGA